MDTSDATGPHTDRPPATAGSPLDVAGAAVVLVHGQGRSAGAALELADDLYHPGVAFLAPRAADDTWFPKPFLAPTEFNEPHLSSALAAVGDAVERADDAGVPAARVALVGVTQGACLVSEFAARNPTRYGGVAALHGGLVGPEDADREYGGSLEGTPAYLASSDDDPYVPVDRVHETAATFERLDADVTERIHEGTGRSVTEEDVDRIATMVGGLPAETDPLPGDPE